MQRLFIIVIIIGFLASLMSCYRHCCESCYEDYYGGKISSVRRNPYRAKDYLYQDYYQSEPVE